MKCSFAIQRSCLGLVSKDWYDRKRKDTTLVLSIQAIRNPEKEILYNIFLQISSNELVYQYNVILDPDYDEE